MTDTWPVRLLVVVLALTVTARLASPCPEAGETCIQETPLCELQVQSRAATTETSSWLPVAGTLAAVGPREIWHLTPLGPESSVTLVPPHAVRATAESTAASVRAVEEAQARPSTRVCCAYF